MIYLNKYIFSADPEEIGDLSHGGLSHRQIYYLRLHVMSYAYLHYPHSICSVDLTVLCLPALPSQYLLCGSHCPMLTCITLTVSALWISLSLVSFLRSDDTLFSKCSLCLAYSDCMSLSAFCSARAVCKNNNNELTFMRGKK